MSIANNTKKISIKLSFCIDTTIAVAMTTFCATFIFFFTLHRGKQHHQFGAKHIPTISLTGAYLPGDIIFTYGIHLISLTLALIYTFVYYGHNYLIYKNVRDGLLSQTTKLANNINSYNVICWRIAMLGIFLLTLTGSISVTINPYVHGAVAFFMFLSLLLYNILFYTKITRKIQTDSKITNMQFFAVLFGIPFVIVIYIIAGVVYHLCEYYTCTSFVVNVNVALEYWIVFTISLFIYSFRLQDIVMDIDFHYEMDSLADTNTSGAAQINLTSSTDGLYLRMGI